MDDHTHKWIILDGDEIWDLHACCEITGCNDELNKNEIEIRLNMLEMKAWEDATTALRESNG